MLNMSLNFTCIIIISDVRWFFTAVRNLLFERVKNNFFLLVKNTRIKLIDFVFPSENFKERK